MAPSNLNSHNNQCKSASEKPLWTPDPSKLEEQNLEKFRKIVNQKYNLNLETYHDLHKWSVENRAIFWAEVWTFTGVIASAPCDGLVVDESLSINRIPKWFQGAKLNYAENLLEKTVDRDKIAVYYKGEGHPQVQTLTYAQLRNRVNAWAKALKATGVRKGDVVAGVLPNCPETLVAVLATASLGAVWTCTSPEYGITGVVERFQQTEPKVIISVNGVFYNDKFHPMLEKLEQIVQRLPNVSKTVVIPFVNLPETMDSKRDFSGDWTTSEDFISKFIQESDDHVVYEQVSFDHPLFIMYSSGTTGKPKCMVHSVGGTLIKHLEEHILQSSLCSDDVIFYYTTTGWMMYNWLISSLAAGCSIVLYDGSPSCALWSLIPELGITIFGTSAKWLAVQEEQLVKEKLKAIDIDMNESKLRMILSTGSPLKPQSFDFVYNYVKRDVVLGSIAGGTDIIGCFMGQNTVLPVYKGEIQSYHLGCDLNCVDEAGTPVLNEAGELVVQSAFPSMPTNFYNDPEGLLYKKAYFDKFEGLWAHGDFMLVNPKTRGIVMLGRSDATLNPSGVRFGSAEIYQIVERFTEIVDSVCVGQRNSAGTDERVCLFLRIAEGAAFSNELVAKLKKAIREQLSPRHVPAVILPINEIPYTISGKKVELAVRNVIEGVPVKNLSALANPQSLDLYKNLTQLSSW